MTVAIIAASLLFGGCTHADSVQPLLEPRASAADQEEDRAGRLDLAIDRYMGVCRGHASEAMCSLEASLLGCRRIYSDEIQTCLSDSLGLEDQSVEFRHVSVTIALGLTGYRYDDGDISSGGSLLDFPVAVGRGNVYIFSTVTGEDPSHMVLHELILTGLGDSSEAQLTLARTRVNFGDPRNAMFASGADDYDGGSTYYEVYGDVVLSSDGNLRALELLGVSHLSAEVADNTVIIRFDTNNPRLRVER